MTHVCFVSVPLESLSIEPEDRSRGAGGDRCESCIGIRRAIVAPYCVSTTIGSREHGDNKLQLFELCKCRGAGILL